MYVEDEYSWLTRPNSPQRLFEWWKAYWASDLDLIQTIEVEEGLARGSDMDNLAKRPTLSTATRNHILILKRR